MPCVTPGPGGNRFSPIWMPGVLTFHSASFGGLVATERQKCLSRFHHFGSGDSQRQRTRIRVTSVWLTIMARR
jgi:hypothetical protein